MSRQDAAQEPLLARDKNKPAASKPPPLLPPVVGTTKPSHAPVKSWSERVELVSAALHDEAATQRLSSSSGAECMIGTLHQLKANEPKDQLLLNTCQKYLAERPADWQASIAVAFEQWGQVKIWSDQPLGLVQIWASDGVPRAMAELGRRYRLGLGFREKDLSQALYWFKKAGFEPHALTNLAAMYESGEGMARRDYDEAIRLYSQAAAEKFPVAMLRLGDMFSKGRGVQRDYSVALGWYRKAADLGDAVAMRTVADFYAAGRGGLPRDLQQELLWRKNAARAGDEESQQWLRNHVK